LCAAAYCYRYELVQHQQLGVHSARPFVCAKCGASFTSSYGLVRHNALDAREFLARVIPAKVNAQEELLARAFAEMQAEQELRAARATAGAAAAGGSRGGGGGGARVPSPEQLASHDPYVVLGLPGGADARVIRRRYLELARLLHPDQQARNTGRAVAGDGAFVLVQRAYDAIASGWR